MVFAIESFPQGMCLFATLECAEGLEEAKQYCRENKFTAEQVKIVKTSGMVVVKKK